MLSKEICIICIAHFDKWEKTDDDMNWDEGYINCPGGHMSFIIEAPRYHCEYTLEHVISDQEL